MAKQSIPYVSGGTIELESGKVVEFETRLGAEWLAATVIDAETGKEKGRSFRYESMRSGLSYTVRNQPIRGIGYWYGSKKIAGKLHKCYIGKLENMTIDRLEAVAEKLSNPEPKAPKTVVEAASKSVGESERIEALENQLASVWAALEDLRGKLQA